MLNAKSLSRIQNFSFIATEAIHCVFFPIPKTFVQRSAKLRRPTKLICSRRKVKRTISVSRSYSLVMGVKSKRKFVVSYAAQYYFVLS